LRPISAATTAAPAADIAARVRKLVTIIGVPFSGRLPAIAGIG
jgi:hypothetical protein